jgi:hypothetical protein
MLACSMYGRNGVSDIGITADATKIVHWFRVSRARLGGARSTPVRGRTIWHEPRNRLWREVWACTAPSGERTECYRRQAEQAEDRRCTCETNWSGNPACGSHATG